MAASADFEFEINEPSTLDASNTSHHNFKQQPATHRDSLSKESFFRLDPNWGKNKPYSFEKVLPSTQTSSNSNTNECAVPTPDNSTHESIQLNTSVESRMEIETIQCNLCKKTVKSTRGLKLHQRSCKSKLPDEISESNKLEIRSTENNINIFQIT